MRWRLSLAASRDDFSLEVKLDEEAPILGLFGPSGAGKSSLLEAIAGILPSRGQIELGGRALEDLPAHRRRLGIVHQDGRLFPHLTVAANLRYGGQRGDHPAFEEIVEMLELGDFLERSPEALSGGEARRVALGRALLSNPDCLLLDEPFAGVDLERRQRLIPFLHLVHERFELPMLVISHELVELLELTDRLALLEEGKVLGCGLYTELIHDHSVLARLLPGGLPNVWPVKIAAGEDGGACRLEAENGPVLWGPPLEGAGGRASAVLRAADVALSLERVEGISVRNQWRGTIRRVEAYDGRRIVELDLGRPLLVELTEGSWQRLRLEIGSSVWALIKANAVRVHRG